MDSFVTSDQRARRDQRILSLSLAGLSYREIGRVVDVKSPTTIGRIIRRELDRETPRRELLADQAVLVERNEALLRAHWPAAIRGSYRSSVIVLRILGQQQKMAELAVAAARPKRHDPTEGADDEDDLTRWRRQRLDSAV